MNVEALRNTDWVKAATRAHMILSQSLTDEELDGLTLTEAEPAVTTERCAA